jgi:hypothetical protein
VKGGAFTALLGSVTPLPKEARTSKGWLAVSVRGPGEAGFTALAPRQPLNAAAPASPSSPAAGPSCPHDHFGELWTYNSTGTPGYAGLQVNDTRWNGLGVLGEASNGPLATGVDGYSDSGYGVTGFTANGTGVYGYSTSGAGVLGLGATYGVSGTAGIAGVYGYSTSGRGVYGKSTNDVGVYGESASNTGVAGKSTSGVGVWGESENSRGVYGVSTNDVGVWGQSTYNTGVAGKSGNGVGVFAVSFINNPIVAQGGNPPHNVFRVDYTGKGYFNGGHQDGGADVAEFIQASDSVQAGDVVEIDPDHAGQFRLAATPNSTAVAGVISTNPGESLGAIDPAGTENSGPQLALAGRVPVKVSAENGAIRPGDLLVASATPGHAMRAPGNPAPGTVIGKALGTLDSGTGTIEMLAMLR